MSQDKKYQIIYRKTENQGPTRSTEMTKEEAANFLREKYEDKKLWDVVDVKLIPGGQITAKDFLSLIFFKKRQVQKAIIAEGKHGSK